MYIYEGHLGGLYTTDFEQDFDDLYCEQCGDSDWEVGRAETMEEAWNLLEDDTEGCSPCDICGKSEGSGNDLCSDESACKDCEVGSFGRGWGLLYMMNFLEENFDCENPDYVYLIAYQGDAIFVQQTGYTDITKYEIPSSFCVSPELREKLAVRLADNATDNLFWKNQEHWEEYDTDREPEFIGELRLCDKNCYVYALSIDDRIEIDTSVLSFDGECWTGFMDEKSLELDNIGQDILEFFKKGRDRNEVE